MRGLRTQKKLTQIQLTCGKVQRQGPPVHARTRKGARSKYMRKDVGYGMVPGAEGGVCRCTGQVASHLILFERWLAGRWHWQCASARV